MKTFAPRYKRKNTMDVQELLNDLQMGITSLQSKLNLLKSMQLGQPYDVDVLLTRKEAAYYIGRSTRQLDRLCDQELIKRESVNGTIRIPKSSLQEYLGLVVRPADDELIQKGKSAFDKIVQRYV